MAASNNLKPVPVLDEGESTSGIKLGKWSGTPWMWRGVSLASTVFFPLIVMFATPLIAKGFGLTAFSGLVSFAQIKETPWIFAALFGQAVVMALWYASQIRVMQNMETTVNELKAETHISVWMGLLMMAIGAWSLGAYGSLYWSFLIPGLAQILDGPGSAATAINNAAQKPILQRH